MDERILTKTDNSYALLENMNQIWKHYKKR